MMAKIAKVLAAAGAVLATVGSQACFFVIMDEPNCPKSLIK
jgi:cyclic lactone autoinducer peptide